MLSKSFSNRSACEVMRSIHWRMGLRTTREIHQNLALTIDDFFIGENSSTTPHTTRRAPRLTRPGVLSSL